jgi:hypothetical protein
VYRDTYKIGRSDEVNKTAVRVKQLTDRFVWWTQLNDAYRALVATLQQPAGQPDRVPVGTAIRADSDFLLDMTGVEPAGTAEAQTLAQRLIEQAAVNELYAAARRRLPPPPWATNHPIAGPDAIYRAAPALEARKVEDWHALRYRLLRALRLLEHPDGVAAVEQATAAGAGIADAEQIVGVQAFDIPWPRPVRELGRALVLHFEGPDHIRRVVRRSDWAVFWLVATLTALAYLLPAYNGKDYGSLEDYLTAFAAGAVAPTVINWALLPFARSGTVEAKVAKPDAGATDAA